MKNVRPDRVMFLDIETVPQYPNYLLMPIELRNFWDKKATHLNKRESPLKQYVRAGIYAEFGKIVCISAGFINTGKKADELRIKSFFGTDESSILSEFKRMLTKFDKNEETWLCAHNGKEFDYPFIARRMLLNNIEIPDILDLRNKKPWEVKHFDTMDMWRFGDYKHYTSLDLLCHIFDIPTPKDNLDGSMVGQTYWVEKDIKSIVKYCQKDVVATTRLFLKYLNKPIIDDSHVIITNT